jgi:DNA-binding ferritin-like protein
VEQVLAGRPGAGRLTPAEFVAELDERNQALLRRLAPDATLAPEVAGDLTVVNLLKVALKNEIEATEIAARWLVTTDEVDVKLALARQVGDEAKHYRMIAERLRGLGFDARTFDPLAKGYGPLFQYLDGLTTTVERVAAGQFTREAIAVVKNRQFIEFCEHAGDRETAAMYRDVIEPDERYHHELGRTLLLRLATTPAAQAAASSAARKTLELADELQKKALATAGIHHAPGC